MGRIRGWCVGWGGVGTTSENFPTTPASTLHILFRWPTMKVRRKTNKRTGADTVTSGSGNVFADLGFPPKEAAELKVKADLTRQIHQRIKEPGPTQARAADRIGLSQPDVSKLMSGRHSGFSVERMLSVLSALEVDVDIVVRPKASGRKFRLGTVRVMDAAHA